MFHRRASTPFTLLPSAAVAQTIRQRRWRYPLAPASPNTFSLLTVLSSPASISPTLQHSDFRGLLQQQQLQLQTARTLPRVPSRRHTRKKQIDVLAYKVLRTGRTLRDIAVR